MEPWNNDAQWQTTDVGVVSYFGQDFLLDDFYLTGETINFNQLDGEQGTGSPDHPTISHPNATERPYQNVHEHDFRQCISENTSCEQATRTLPIDGSALESTNTACPSEKPFSSTANIPASDDTTQCEGPTKPKRGTGRKKMASATGQSKKTLKSARELVCANCAVTKTPLWRRSRQGLPLCNACGLYFKQYQTHRPLRVRRCSLQQFARTGSVAELMQTQEHYKGEIDARIEEEQRRQSIQHGVQEPNKRQLHTHHDSGNCTRDATATNSAFTSTLMLSPQEHAPMQTVAGRMTTPPSSELNYGYATMSYEKMYGECSTANPYKKRRPSGGSDSESDSSSCSRRTACGVPSPVPSPPSFKMNSPIASSFQNMLQAIDKTDAVRMLEIFEERCRYLRSVIAGEMADKYSN